MKKRIVRKGGRRPAEPSAASCAAAVARSERAWRAAERDALGLVGGVVLLFVGLCAFIPALAVVDSWHDVTGPLAIAAGVLLLAAIIAKLGTQPAAHRRSMASGIPKATARPR